MLHLFTLKYCIKDDIESSLHYLHADTLPLGVPSFTQLLYYSKPSWKKNFSFMDRHFLQMVGTDLGTKADPP